MVNIAGKYQLVENKNFYQFLVDIGAPADKAKEFEKEGKIEITVDGNQVTVAYGPPPSVHTYVLGQAIDEKINENTTFKSTATLEGNVLKVLSTNEGQPSGSRTFTFSDSGLEAVFTAPKDGKTISGSRIYKRI